MKASFDEKVRGNKSMEAQARFELVAKQLIANERSLLPQALELGQISKPLRRLHLGQLLEVG